MKRTIIALFALLMLCASVSAFVMPCPIHGVITKEGMPVKNLEITVKNLGTGTSGTTITNDKGFYQVDLGNIDDRYRAGDTLEISLTFCSESDVCKKTAVIQEGGTKIDFNVGVEQQLPDETVIVKYVCWNGEGVSDLSQCPKQDVKEKIICEDGTEVLNAEDCPEPQGVSVLYKILIGLAIAVLGIFSWGKGFTALANYYFKKGKEEEAKGHTRIAQKYYDRAAKMLKTALKKAKDGEYN